MPHAPPPAFQSPRPAPTAGARDRPRRSEPAARGSPSLQTPAGPLPFPDAIDGSHAVRLRRLGWWAGTTALLLVLAAAWAAASPERVVVLPWFVPAKELVCILAGLAIAFSASGHYEARGWAYPLLIQLGFLAATILSASHLLAFPGLFPGFALAGTPSLAAYYLLSLYLVLGGFLVAAATWGARRAVARMHARWWTAAAIALTVGFAVALRLWEDRLPVLITQDGRRTSAINGLGLAAALVTLAAVITHWRAFRRTREPLTGYVALAATVGLLWTIGLTIPARRFGPFWYANHTIRVAEYVVVLFGLLSEHVWLYRAAARSEARHRALVDDVKDYAIVMLDPDGRVASWNAGAERIIGYGAGEIVGRDFALFYPADDVEQGKPARLLAAAAAEGRSADEGWRVRKDGSRFWASVAITALRDAGGRLIGFSSITRDLTERRQAEEALREREASFRFLFANNPMPMWVYDAETRRFLEVNAAAVAHYGYSREEFLRMRIDDIRPPEDVPRLLEVVRQSADGLKHSGEWRHRLKDGRIIDVEIVSHRLVFAGRPAALVVAHDVTERKRAERELRALTAELERRVAERTSQLELANKELEAFSYSVSHDLRAPLRSIDGFSQALLEDYADRLDPQGQEYLRRARAASQRMAELIDDLLNLARVARADLRREPVDLSAMARAIAGELQRSQPERRAAFVIADGLVASGDPRLLRVALVNLLGNAWKFTGKQPEARIEFGRTHRDGEPAYFVRDDGAGFDMAYVGKLFGPFQRLHGAAEFEGTGIGLATVQRIVHRHGGRVWAEGAVGRGATFYFTLP